MRPADPFEVAAWAVFGYATLVDCEQIIATLRANEQALRHRGVLHAALFGSVARGDATPASDIDIMIEIEPDAPVGVFEYGHITQYIADLFEGPVDVLDREGLNPMSVRP